MYIFEFQSDSLRFVGISSFWCPILEFLAKILGKKVAGIVMFNIEEQKKGKMHQLKPYS